MGVMIACMHCEASNGGHGHPEAGEHCTPEKRYDDGSARGARKGIRTKRRGKVGVNDTQAGSNDRCNERGLHQAK